ncbi:colicin V synthesis protein [Candidatus Symbiopectobacterium sp. 'North America']|uniref:peptidase domain-containing ABC transporter n=1 Tax=Candidatus Symbiopectobacterium sp. 'North America' TaxID=2794574 RepID=UPI0018CAD290|nr:peptidase domain-containing ABC transporter [Candidatus Symbiopectobacterium sp. 'North America']MBG6244578.1 colicin V synthesis protein [Candidatus Symbiopectobacterium sp. 'North America']
MNSRWRKSIIDQLDLGLRRRLPMLHQTESAECGLACLAMICSYYGKNIDLNALRQQFRLSTRGTTLAGLNDFAAQLGMTTRALSVDLHELQALKTPCILHWNFNHFVVLVSAKHNRFVVHDTAQGRRTVELAEISRCFTGIALEVWPGSEFKAEEVTKRLSAWQLIRSVHWIKGALIKIFCLSLIIEAITLIIIPVGTQLVMDHALPAADRGLLSLIRLALVFFILLRAAISMVRAWSSLVMGTLINVQWQSGLFMHLLHLPLDYFEKRKLGDIHSRFGSLDTLRATFTASVVGGIMDSIMVTGVLIMMWLYGGHLTLLVVGFTLVYILTRFATYRYYRQLSEEALVRSARANSYFMETLYGIATIKMQGMGERRHTHWLNLQVDTLNTGIRITRLDLLFGGVNTFIAACDQVVILWFGIDLVIDNQMTLGMFVAFSAFRSQFSDRIASLVAFILQLRMMGLHNERISDIALRERETIMPTIGAQADMRPLSLTTQALSFRYDSISAPVFFDLNMTIAPGESVAIAGPSGVGKTTLMKVLRGLFTPESGKVLIDGNDIQHIGVNNYRKMIGCVLQEDRLFSASIRENICGFEQEMDDAWMMECARASYIHDTIMALPMGYETLIGELDEGLSGRQKQRLFIARALYRKPGILFLDEATSALDKESEAAVNLAIRQMNITRIIITHRESTLASADRIITLGTESE